jgi:hypothetical protein
VGNTSKNVDEKMFVAFQKNIDEKNARNVSEKY